jgi:hypothetical protein
MRLEHVESFFVGLDLGQAGDFSAMAVIGRRVEGAVPGVLDPETWYPMYYAVEVKQFELGTEYHQVEEEVARVWRLPELAVTSNWCVVDKTGVGAPVVESIRRRMGIPVQGVIITGGENVSNSSPNEYTVPKSHIVTALMDLAQRRRFKVSQGVANEKEFFDQMDQFGYKLNRNTGNMSYEALEERVHDDLVIAAGLAVWFAERVHPWRPAWRDDGEVVNDYNPLTGRGG